MKTERSIEELPFWRQRQFGVWDLSRFDRNVYESVVGAIIKLSRIAGSYPTEAAATSATWVIGGLMIELDWNGGVLTISTGWMIDHQQTAYEQHIYREVSGLLGQLKARPVQGPSTVQ